MRKMFIAAAMIGALASPAIAKDITITLTDQDQSVLRALLDLAAKQGGFQAAPAVTYFAKKIQPEDRPLPISPDRDQRPSAPPSAPPRSPSAPGG